MNKVFAIVFAVLFLGIIFTIFKKHKTQNKFELLALIILGLSLFIRGTYAYLRGFDDIVFNSMHYQLFISIPYYLFILILMILLRPWIELHYRLKKKATKAIGASHTLKTVTYFILLCMALLFLAMIAMILLVEEFFEN